jgi:flavin-binding protein dodecin
MKSIYLDTMTREYTVTDEGYETIKQLLRQYTICQWCKLPYTQENLCVARNTCLACLLSRQTDLTFIGPAGVDTYQRQQFTFLDTAGYIHLSTAESSEEAKKNINLTLAHWNFPLPTTFWHHGQKATLTLPILALYGELTKSVIVIHYHEPRPKLDIAFLSYKGGTCKELTKWDRAAQQVLDRAHDSLEATKQGEVYHINGHTSKKIQKHHIWQVAAVMESALYDIQQTLTNGAKQPEKREQQS